MQDIKLYSLPTCPWCMKLKEFFKERKIKYQNIDVSASQKNADEMIKKSGQMGVPVIEIDKQIIVGFDLPKIKKALKLEG